MDSLILIAAFLLGLVTTSALAQNNTQSASVRQVELLLGAIHDRPSRKVLEAADPKAEQIVRDHATMEPRSIRRYAALGALAQWPTAETRAVFELRLADATDPAGQRRAARLLATTFGDSSVPTLAAAWPKADVNLRRTLVAALLDAGPSAQVELQRFLADETSKWVRADLVAATRILK